MNFESRCPSVAPMALLMAVGGALLIHCPLLAADEVASDSVHALSAMSLFEEALTLTTDMDWIPLGSVSEQIEFFQRAVKTAKRLKAEDRLAVVLAQWETVNLARLDPDMTASYCTLGLFLGMRHSLGGVTLESGAQPLSPPLVFAPEVRAVQGIAQEACHLYAKGKKQETIRVIHQWVRAIKALPAKLWRDEERSTVRSVCINLDLKCEEEGSDIDLVGNEYDMDEELCGDGYDMSVRRARKLAQQGQCREAFRYLICSEIGCFDDDKKVDIFASEGARVACGYDSPYNECSESGQFEVAVALHHKIGCDYATPLAFPLAKMGRLDEALAAAQYSGEKHGTLADRLKSTRGSGWMEQHQAYAKSVCDVLENEWPYVTDFVEEVARQYASKGLCEGALGILRCFEEIPFNSVQRVAAICSKKAGCARSLDVLAAAKFAMKDMDYGWGGLAEECAKQGLLKEAYRISTWEAPGIKRAEILLDLAWSAASR